MPQHPRLVGDGQILQNSVKDDEWGMKDICNAALCNVGRERGTEALSAASDVLVHNLLL